MSRLATTAISIVAACALLACAPGTYSPYQRPDSGLPANIAEAGPKLDTGTWWKTFQDPVLDALMQEAAGNSQDIALATGRIAEARATLNQNSANFYPTVDLNASVARRQASQNSASFNTAAPAAFNDLQLGLSASYEIDFWGKFARADDAARARLLGQAASHGTVLTTLYANVAQSYFALRALDAQVLLAGQTLTTRQENLRLQQRRFEDLSQAEAEAASVEASLQQTRQNQRNTESALALLLGRKPADIAKPVIARGMALPALYGAQGAPANLPSDLLNRRPDLIAAEQNLIAANADIGQARAAYFPRLALTAGLGQQSQELSNLFNPASLFWNLLGNLTQPVFRAGAIDAVVAAANARQQQALAQYTQAVQSAFRDVHDALNNVQAGREVTATTARRIDALRNSLRLAELRYKAGYSGYLEVLTAQRDLAQAEIGLIDSQRSQLAAVVSLYKALGGGWDADSLVGQAAKSD
jgi:outer membrane protein, multidrug efflux system